MMIPHLPVDGFSGPERPGRLSWEWFAGYDTVMVSFLFWNLFKKPLLDRVVRLVRTHDIDVLMLAECVIEPAEIEARLRGEIGRSFMMAPSNGSKVRIFTKLAAPFIEEFNDPIGGLTIRRAQVGPPPGILLAAVHLPSRVSLDKDDQLLHVAGIIQDIAQTEDRLANNRTILVGDLNMNPFDLGVVGASGLHAVMTRDLARREARMVIGKSRRFFYNPMWGHFGDRTPGPPGTFHRQASSPGNTFWNIYDQVLLRPALMDSLDDLRILASDGEQDLVTKGGLPKISDGSDHLPIYFRLAL